MAKDGVLGGVEVCHKEVHILSTEVVGGANLDWQGDLPQKVGMLCLVQYHKMENQ